MKQKNIIRILIVILFASAIIDTLSTVRYQNFTIAESNIVYSLTGSITIVIIIKFLINTLMALSITYPKYLAKTNFAKFFYIHFIIIIIFAQTTVGIVNSYQISKVTEAVNIIRVEQDLEPYANPGEVPKEMVKLAVPEDKKFVTKQYFKMAGLIIYLPFFLALISFKVWDSCYNIKTKNV